MTKKKINKMNKIGLIKIINLWRRKDQLKKMIFKNLSKNNKQYLNVGKMKKMIQTVKMQKQVSNKSQIHKSQRNILINQIMKLHNNNI